MVEFLERAMQFKVAKFVGSTTYTVTTAASPTFYTCFTATFTPGTADNIILGIRLTAKVTTQGSSSHSVGRLRFQVPAADVMTGAAEEDFLSSCLYQQDGSKSNFQLPWVQMGYHTPAQGATFTATANSGSWIGKEQYVFIFEAARRDASDNISNVQIEIYYLTGTESKGAITIV